MTIIQELKIFLRNILYWLYCWVATSFFFFIFGPVEVPFWGKKLFVPLPAPDTFSVMYFNMIRNDLLPSGVELMVTNPMSAFVGQMIFSFLMGFLFTFPYFIYKIIVYLKPALFPHEKRAIMWSLIPFVILFSSGSLFAYKFIIPATFSIFYPYATSIGATTYFALDEFINYVFSLMLSVGIMFLLPIFMIVLSMIGIVRSSFWKNKWRHAIVVFLIISAIITPDGTGITMVMLFVPLTVLYFGGYYFAKKLSD